MTQKFMGHPLLGFLPTTGSSATHIRGQWENLVCRNHAGSDSYRGGGLHRQKSRRQQQSRSAQVLRKRNSSGKASSDAGQELAGRAAERRWKARRP